MTRHLPIVKQTPGPLNQCEHPNMMQCCPPSGDAPGCGHWHCGDCGLSWDEEGEGGPPFPTQAEIEEDARFHGGSSK